MTHAAATKLETPSQETMHRPLRVVLCGSYRRDASRLELDFRRLEFAGCDIVSPIGIDFVAEQDGFVLSAAEVGRSPQDIEAAHIAALEEADFVWLTMPNGYIGPSAALELGVAAAHGLPVFSDSEPREEVMKQFVRVVADPERAKAEVVQAGPSTPARALGVLQRYYNRAADSRGWQNESPRDILLLLTEELGELSRAVRIRQGLARDHDAPPDTTGLELADVQLYLLHLATALETDLAEAVREKERINMARVENAHLDVAA